MGKDWDKAVPSVETWRECLRVLKNGAFMFIMSAPRQDVLSQMIVRLAQAGFDTGFTSIYWTYVSGFPKSLNIGKAIDKKLGYKRKQVKASGNLQNVNLNDDDWMKIGKDDASMDSNEPISSQSKALNGSYGGFQPKPAVEIIIVCMKPLSEKTYVDQALKNGKGVTWLDDARIPFQSEADKEQRKKDDIGSRPNQGQNYGKVGEKIYGSGHDSPLPSYKSEGRFPANLLVSDDVLNDGKITKSREDHRSEQSTTGDSGIYGKNWRREPSLINDSGSFSRYFDLDKWFEKTVENLPESVKQTFPFLICPKASKSERDKGLENLPEKEVKTHGESSPDVTGGSHNTTGQKPAIRKNIHPTVKPIKLMSYLITLGSREGDIVLDPFVGSGTTCISAKILNRKWIGIDNNLEYCQIASARLENCEIVKHDNIYGQYSKDMQEQPQSLIETKKEEVIRTKGTCPKCGAKMYEGKRGYYCVKANCDGRTEK